MLSVCLVVVLLLLMLVLFVYVRFNSMTVYANSEVLTSVTYLKKITYTKQRQQQQQQRTAQEIR